MEERIASSLRTLILCAIAALMGGSAHAQTIRLVRSDVEAGRSGFVTATQSFGVDVVVDSIANCTSVSFELRFTNAKHVVFSHWKTRDLGKKGVFVYDLSDSLGNGSVHVGALSGMGATDSAFTNPVVIHLDFVVLPDAPNDSTISFSFVYPQAVVTDSGGTIVKLNSVPYTATVHGFVQVHPGDADNNGIVDSRDATTVGAFLKQGSGTSNVRGYKREPASTLWLPQAALVWDSAQATYADCDGSGDVTLSDNLVVQINFGKTHSKTQSNSSIQSAKRSVYPAELQRVPVRIQAAENLLGVALSARLVDASARVIGFEPAESLPGVFPGYMRCDDGSLLLVFGSEQGQNSIRPGVAGYLVFESASCPVEMTHVLGATADGRIFPLYQTTATNSDDHTCPTDDAQCIRVRADRASSMLSILGLPATTDAEVVISNVTGKELVRTRIQENGNIPLSLPSGLYVVNINTAQPFATTFSW